MARGTRDRRLADAHAELRKLRNQLHEAGLAHLPLRAEIQQLTNDAQVRERHLARARRAAGSCRAALLALMEAISAMVSEDGSIAPIDSGKNG